MIGTLKVEEAAKYLGVTPQTLRNWDKSGKLPATRQENNYRLYSINDLDMLKNTMNITEYIGPIIHTDKEHLVKNGTELKRFIAQLHNHIRNLDASSSIIDRFDEVTKLLLLKVHLKNEIEQYLYDKKHELIRKSYYNFSEKLPFQVPDKFRTIQLSDNALYHCCQFISKYDFSNTNNDLKGVAYEQIIQNTFEKGDNQQFFTPKTIVQFMCDLIQPFAKGSVSDPASGTGGFLINLLKDDANFEHYTALEIDERLAWITGLNLELHNSKSYESICLLDGGSLGKERANFHNKYDVVITNPPFGSDFNDQNSLKNFVLGKNRSSRRRGVLFIEQCVDMLKDGGFLAIVIDEGVLNHATNEDVRSFMLKYTELHAVISLPDTAFMPYASVKTSILLVRKTKNPDKSVKTFFATIHNIGRKPNGQEDYVYTDEGKEVLNNDFPMIFNLWKEYARTKQVLKSEDVFLANVYDTFNNEINHRYRIDLPFHHFSRNDVKQLLHSHKTKLIKLSEICIEVHKTIVPAQDKPDESIIYTGLAHIEANSEIAKQAHVATNSLKSSAKYYQKNDILFSKMRPTLRKCVAINFEESGYCSAECIVLRLRPEYENIITPRLLSALLRSDFVYGQLVHLITGIGRPRVSKKDVLNILIPIPKEEASKKLVEGYIDNMDKIKRVKQKADKLLAEAKLMHQQITNNLVKAITGEV